MKYYTIFTNYIKLQQVVINCNNLKRIKSLLLFTCLLLLNNTL